ncbi:MAG: tetratricopeptide repeat protein [Flectobacillus sp.]|nr:tetratricopeptide repeat protein [Flectobacillus sp.]
MRRILFIIILLLHSISSTAQNKLMGWVTEQNSGKKTVGGVSIKSSELSNSISSSAKGEFTLTFQGLDIGESVILRPEKVGWELVNEKEMQVNLPAQPTENKVKVVLCKAGTLALAKQAYYKVADPYIIQQYNKKLAALDKEKSSYQAEKAKLQEERNRLQNQLAEYAEEFIRINLDDASDIERRAIALFKEGRIDESIQLRESLKSGKEIRKAVSDKAKADSIIALHTRNLKALAKEYIFKFDFKSAEDKYKELVSADTSNFDNTFDYAYFLQNQNKYNSAVSYYLKALKLAKNDHDSARDLNNLGILYKEKGNYVQALEQYQKALVIYSRLIVNNPQTYEPYLAFTLNNLGSLYQREKKYTEALSTYKKALEISEKLLQIQPETYEQIVAMAQNNLGILYSIQNEDSLALIAYSKSLKIFLHLMSIDQNTYNANVAKTQNNLGILYEKRKEYSLALNAYNESLRFFELLAKQNPDTYGPSLALIQYNLGGFYHKREDYIASSNILNESLERFDRLVISNPEIYKPYIANIHYRLGCIYEIKKDFNLALATFEKALNAYGCSSEITIANCNSAPIPIWKKLGDLYSLKNDSKKASIAYQQYESNMKMFINESLFSYMPTKRPFDKGNMMNRHFLSEVEKRLISANFDINLTNHYAMAIGQSLENRESEIIFLP